jgi:mannose/fructose/N-acetylgalactosamine-specific phosphotransferase system component IIB
MENVIIRVDDRLIHGQVLVGWVTQLNIHELVVANDEIASNDWEKEMMMMAAADVPAKILTISQTAEEIKNWVNENVKRLILLESVADLQSLIKLGLPIKTINIGGIHYVEGRKTYLPYVYLNPNEVTILKKILMEGYVVECQDVPTGTKYSLEKILNKIS